MHNQPISPMFYKLVRMEQSKLAHSMVWFALFLLPAIAAFLGAGNYYINQDLLNKHWYSLWTQVLLFYGDFIGPATLGILCSYLIRLEHSNHNWNKLLSAPISPMRLYLAKYCFVCLLGFLLEAMILLFYLFAGFLFRFQDGLPASFPLWILCGMISTLSICAVQLYLSLRIRSFAIPIGLAFVGSFTGIGLIAKGLGLFFPYSGLVLGMGIVNQTGLPLSDIPIFILMNLLWTILFLLLGKRLFCKQSCC